jgi:hypothetical protein
MHLDLPPILPDEDHGLQGRHPRVVFELLAEIVVNRGRAEDFDEDGWVDHGVGAVGIGLDGAADDRYIGIARQPGGRDADAEIRAVHAAASVELAAEQRLAEAERAACSTEPPAIA